MREFSWRWISDGSVILSRPPDCLWSVVCRVHPALYFEGVWWRSVALMCCLWCRAVAMYSTSIVAIEVDNNSLPVKGRSLVVMNCLWCYQFSAAMPLFPEVLFSRPSFALRERRSLLSLTFQALHPSFSQAVLFSSDDRSEIFSPAKHQTHLKFDSLSNVGWRKPCIQPGAMGKMLAVSPSLPINTINTLGPIWPKWINWD